MKLKIIKLFSTFLYNYQSIYILKPRLRTLCVKKYLNMCIHTH